ncbi:hypothetical protein DFH07DRAFT_978699 [Mycena maculata]|uniref:Uncharacterized protein n=1 Tax=Mycena maculata TaxID=230809 RepID=A0AAD7N3J1_9AGAR|nr:hypothetical protein DFH07DRAFT_978699 [Mycena maculata]
MSNSSSFAPPGEDGFDLWVERSNLDGVLLAGVAYGILFTITVQTLLMFLRRGRNQIPWGLVTYSVFMFILASIGLGGNAKFNEMTFIDDRNIPGGPNAFTEEFFTTPVNLMAFVAYILMSWLADGLVLWRFTLIWNYQYWLSVFPVLMFLGSVTSSLALIVTTVTTNPVLAEKSVQFGIAYWSLSISLNIVLTMSIVGRLLFVRRHAHGTGHTAQYVSIAAMLIESAALYAIWSTVFLICYVRQSPLENILLPAQGQIQGIAPLLILFRVAQGRAWSQHTLDTTTQGGGRSRGIPLSDFAATSASRGTQGDLKVNMTTETSQWDGDKPSAV